MNRQVAASLLTCAVASAIAIPAPVAAQSATADAPPRTAWGAPDLGGIWDFRTLIPLERPGAFEGRETLTEEVPLTNVCKESKSSPLLNCVESATCESQQ